MARPLLRAAAILLAAGIVISLVGLGVAWVGLFRPQLISDQIPPGFIDTPAVGGATFALGSGLLLVGLAHIGTAAALRRSARGVSTVAVALSATMSVLALLFAVAAVVSAASASAPASLMLPAAAFLLGGAIAYGAAVAWTLPRRGPTDRG